MPQPVMPFAPRSRLVKIAPGQARGVLVLLAAVLLVVSLAASRGEEATTEAQGAATIHTGIVGAMLNGGDYYLTAVEAFRGAGRSADLIAVRLPTLTVIATIVPFRLLTLLSWLLALGTAATWRRRLAPLDARPAQRLAAALLPLAGAAATVLRPEAALVHEAWAGLFVALSLGIRRPGRVVEAVALGLAAALVLQTAAAYLVVMAAFALLERRRDEALRWGAALVAFVVVLTFHARAVIGAGGVYLPEGGGASAGAIAAIRSVAGAVMPAPVPIAVAAPLALLALVGWFVPRGGSAARVAVVLVGFLLLAMNAAAADVGDAALIVVPLSLTGLILAVPALRDLLRAAFDTRRITVRRVTR